MLRTAFPHDMTLTPHRAAEESSSIRLFASPLVPCAIHYLSQVNIFISNCSLAICFRFIGRVNARHWHDKARMNDGLVENGSAEWLTRTGRARDGTHTHTERDTVAAVVMCEWMLFHGNWTLFNSVHPCSSVVKWCGNAINCKQQHTPYCIIQ